jgi:hypothetical protein
MSSTINLPRLLTERELCDYLKKSQAWAQRARLEGNGPPWFKVGRTPMYPAGRLETWLEQSVRSSTCKAV